MKARFIIAAAVAAVALKILWASTTHLIPEGKYEALGNLQKGFDLDETFKGPISERISMENPKLDLPAAASVAPEANASDAPSTESQNDSANAPKKKKTAIEIFQEQENKKLAQIKKQKARKMRMKKLARKMREQEEQKRLEEEKRKKMFADWLNNQKNLSAKNSNNEIGRGFPYFPAPTPTPEPESGAGLGALKKEGNLSNQDIEAWAQKLTTNPTVQDARTFIAMYFTGQISKEDFYHVINLMKNSPNPKARRFAVMGAGIQQTPEGFMILAEMTLGETNQDVLEAANKSLNSYKTTGSLSVLATALSTAFNVAIRLRAIDLVAEIANLFSKNPGLQQSRDAFRPLVPILENLAKENNPEVKARAQSTLTSVKRILGMA